MPRRPRCLALAACLATAGALHSAAPRAHAQAPGSLRSALAISATGASETGEQLPSIVARAFQDVARGAHASLQRGAADWSIPEHPEEPGSTFEAIQIALPLASPIIKHSPSDGVGLGDKNIVGEGVLAQLGHDCVVYGIGLSPIFAVKGPAFEQEMGMIGCEVHVFDCSVSPFDLNVLFSPWQFHNWCIGSPASAAARAYGNGALARMGLSDAADLPFKSMNDTMAELGHSHVTLLKFDVEGFEWELFEDELLSSPNPPDQLSFELHTQGAKPEYVPPQNVAGKGYREVNRLFLALWDLGYMVASKELNIGDPACAEFVLVRQ